MLGSDFATLRKIEYELTQDEVRAEYAARFGAVGPTLLTDYENNRVGFDERTERRLLDILKSLRNRKKYGRKNPRPADPRVPAV